MKIAFVWNQFGEYHCDRCEAAAAAFADDEVIGVQICQTSNTYAWPHSRPATGYKKVILFSDTPFEMTKWYSRIYRLFPVIWNCEVVFLAGYERLDNFLIASFLRFFGRQVVIMNESKFDDIPRLAAREYLKGLALLPYNSALVGGRRHVEYFRFLGFRGPIATGYDTVSIKRMRQSADLKNSAEVQFSDRPFLFVGRFVEKKNLGVLVEAFSHFRELCPSSSRRLLLVGDGPLFAEIAGLVEELGLNEFVKFTGFLNSLDIAATMKDSLCLVVPSVEEQWGLVVNEALAFDLPIAASTVVGATDSLVRTGINGFLFESDNAAGLCYALRSIEQNEDEWTRLRAGSESLKHYGDTPKFAAGAMACVKYTKE